MNRQFTRFVAGVLARAPAAVASRHRRSYPGRHGFESVAENVKALACGCLAEPVVEAHQLQRCGFSFGSDDGGSQLQAGHHRLREEVLGGDFCRAQRMYSQLPLGDIAQLGGWQNLVPPVLPVAQALQTSRRL